MADDDLPWMTWALGEVGEKEVPGRGSNPRIIEYRKMAGIALDGDDSDVPWCKIFVNAAMLQSGFEIKRNAMARSIENDPNFEELDGPAYGAVVSFWRGSRGSGTGHIGFVTGVSEDRQRVRVLGGNEGDMVKEAWFPKNSAHFGVVGYYWPATSNAEADEPPVLRDNGEPMASAV